MKYIQTDFGGLDVTNRAYKSWRPHKRSSRPSPLVTWGLLALSIAGLLLILAFA